MDELLEWMDYIEDKRQQTKVRHKLKDIIVIVLFATLANVDDWVEMEYFAHYCSFSYRLQIWEPRKPYKTLKTLTGIECL